MLDLERPRVQLLNIGTEATKGTDELQDAAQRLREATGLALDENFIRMFTWFNDVGYQADIPALRAVHPGLLDLESFLRLDGWEERK